MSKKREDVTIPLPDAYGAQYAEAVTSLAQPREFSYDYAADPVWQSYQKQYVREGRRAAEDALGRAAALTGGMPSTAAVTAASQAQDVYAARLSDKLPELYRLAYDMYDAAESRRAKAVDALRAARADELARWDAERSAAADERDFDYKARRDAESDQVAMAKLAAESGDTRGLEALGIDVSERGEKRYAYSDGGDVYVIGTQKGRAFLDSAAPGQSMTGSDGSRWTKSADGSVTIEKAGQTWRAAAAAPAASAGRAASGAAKTKPELTAAQVNAAVKAGVLTDKVLAAYEYYYGAPYDDGSGAALAAHGELPRFTLQQPSAQLSAPAAGAGPRATSAGAGEGLTRDAVAGAGEGLTRDAFNTAGRGVIELWDRGDAAAARAQAAAVWPHLSPAQQTSLRSTLRLHGMEL